MNFDFGDWQSPLDRLVARVELGAWRDARRLPEVREPGGPYHPGSLHQRLLRARRDTSLEDQRRRSRSTAPSTATKPAGSHYFMMK